MTNKIETLTLDQLRDAMEQRKEAIAAEFQQLTKPLPVRWTKDFYQKFPIHNNYQSITAMNGLKQGRVNEDAEALLISVREYVAQLNVQVNSKIKTNERAKV